MRCGALLLWRLHPNGGRVAAVAVPRVDRRRLMDRGWLKVNGHRAVITEFLHEEAAGMDAIRIVFDEPYPDPHP